MYFLFIQNAKNFFFGGGMFTHNPWASHCNALIDTHDIMATLTTEVTLMLPEMSTQKMTSDSSLPVSPLEAVEGAGSNI